MSISAITHTDSPATLPRVAVVILNTNRRDDTLACLRSLQESTYQRLEIIVLDNASTDGSVAAIEAGFPQVQAVHLRENHGYAGNNNVGIELALEQKADWVLILNEDTIVAPDCITYLVTAGESAPDVGIVGPMVYHADEPAVIQSAGGVLNRNWQQHHSGQNQQDEGQFTLTRAVDWISGCALLIRSATIRQVGMLDERLFYYWEEVEWCVRAHQAGWRILHVPQAKLWHKGVQRDYRPSPNVTYYATRNRLLVLAKHQAPLQAWCIAWLETLRTITSWSIRPKWRDKGAHRDAMVDGIYDFVRGRTGMRARG